MSKTGDKLFCKWIVKCNSTLISVSKNNKNSLFQCMQICIYLACSLVRSVVSVNDSVFMNKNVKKEKIHVYIPPKTIDFLLISLNFIYIKTKTPSWKMSKQRHTDTYMLSLCPWSKKRKQGILYLCTWNYNYPYIYICAHEWHIHVTQVQLIIIPIILYLTTP